MASRITEPGNAIAPESTRKGAREGGTDDLRAEYDFSGGVRGKYAASYAAGTNLILLDSALSAEFPDSRLVSRALKAYLKLRRREIR